MGKRMPPTSYSHVFALKIFRVCIALMSVRLFRRPKERAEELLRKTDRRRFACRPRRGFASLAKECARK